MIIPQYILDIQAAWLGKLIGIRLGAPIENWTATQIEKTYGYIEDFLVQYPVFGADDDSNGPLYFSRVFLEYPNQRIMAHHISKTMLNVIPYEHGFFWWGGYGVSTEHTMFLNLHQGIKPPLSGSRELNGIQLSQQIGGQIFSDGWALVAYKDTKEAVYLAEQAACISHDGEGIEGAKFVAAAVSIAYQVKNIEQVLQQALNYCDPQSQYVEVAHEIIAFYKQNPEDWRLCLNHITQHHPYEKYGGLCPIIPNMAIMICAMCYGKQNFRQTLLIGLNCGGDTDCNLGNIGAILGALVGMEGLYQPWVKQINDICISSGLLGSFNMMDVTAQVAYFARIAKQNNPQLPNCQWLNHSITSFQFALPQSTHGFFGRWNRTNEGGLYNVLCENASFNRALQINVHKAHPDDSFELVKKTYYRATDIYDCRYEPAVAPIVWPNQQVTARLKAEINDQWLVKIAIVDLKDCVWESETVLLHQDWVELTTQIPANMSYICEIKLVFESVKPTFLTKIWVDFVNVDQNAVIITDFKDLPMENYGHRFSGGIHQEVAGCTHFNGDWFPSEKGLTCPYDQAGFILYGDVFWKEINALIYVDHWGKDGGVHFRVQGANRWYALYKRDDYTLELSKSNGEVKALRIFHLNQPINDSFSLLIKVTYNIIKIGIQEQRFHFVDEDQPYLTGSLAFSKMENSDLVIRGIEVRTTDFNI